MTTAEMDRVDRFLAEKVMGYEWYGDHYRERHADGSNTYHVFKWHPTRSIAQAMMVLEKTGSYWEIYKAGDNLIGCTTELEEDGRIYYADTPALAISLACEEWGRRKGK